MCKCVVTFDLVTVPELVDDADVEDDHEDERNDEEDDCLDDAVCQASVVTPEGDTVGQIPGNIITDKQFCLNELFAFVKIASLHLFSHSQSYSVSVIVIQSSPDTRLVLE